MSEIKSRTPFFKFNIPEFNIATWHDYVEENFRSIDALLNNLFSIKNFSGVWKTNTLYTAGQVLFVGEDNGSEFEGRLVKIVNDVSTAGKATFSDSYVANPGFYELYADASAAEIYAQQAKDWATKIDDPVEGNGYSAKYYANSAEQSASSAKWDAEWADEASSSAFSYNVAAGQAKNAAEYSASLAKTSEDNAKLSEDAAKLSETNAKDSENKAEAAKTGAESAKTEAISAATSAESAKTETLAIKGEAVAVKEQIEELVESVPDLTNVLVNRSTEPDDRNLVVVDDDDFGANKLTGSVVLGAYINNRVTTEGRCFDNVVIGNNSILGSSQTPTTPAPVYFTSNVGIGTGTQTFGSRNVCIGSGSGVGFGNEYSVAIGFAAHVEANNAIQLGAGTNSTKDTLYIRDNYVYDIAKNHLQELDNYQPLLNSGTNIKTINGTSLLGSGNIEISGGGTTEAVWGTITGTLSNQVDLQNALNGKANISDVYTKTQTDNKIPTTTSQLTNDSGFVSNEIIPSGATATNKLVAKSELPTLVDLAQAGTGIEFERKIQEATIDYTIIGSPDIDANGIMTCDSWDDCISSPTFETFNDTILEFEFTTPSTMSKSSLILHCLQQENANVFMMALATSYRIEFIGLTENRAFSTVLSPSTSYLIRYKRVGNDNTVTLLSSNGTKLEELVITDAITTITSSFFLFGKSDNPTKFDLNKISFGAWRARIPGFDRYEINSTGGSETDVSSHKVNGAPLSNISSYFFGVCETPAATAEKVVSIPSITELNAGQFIFILPTYTASSGSTTTIKLNDFTAYPIKYGNNIVTPQTVRYVLQANYPSMFIFDGNYWIFAGLGIYNSYGSMSVSSGITGTSSSSYLLSPVNLKQIIQGTTLTDIDTTTSSTVVATDSITTAIGKLQAQITTSLGDLETALNTINSGV